MKALFTAGLALLLLSCGTTTTDDLDIDAIRARLDSNACRIIREELRFQMSELEYTNDTTYTAIPTGLLPDSLTVCPVSGEAFLFQADNGDRKVVCPSGHGETEF